MIFPQTSHFDDLQKQKGKRLPCGVFPLRALLFGPCGGLAKGEGVGHPQGKPSAGRSGEAGTPCGRPGTGLHFRRQLFHQALRQAVHFGKIRCLDVVLFQLIVPPVRLGNGQLRLPQQCRGCLLQKADAYPPGFYGAAIIGKALSVDGPARQRYPVQAVAGHKGQPRFRDQQMIQLFGGEGSGAADDMVPPCHCFIP